MKGFLEFFFRHWQAASLLLFIALLPCIAVDGANGKANFSVQIGDTTLAPGEQTTVTIKLSTSGLTLNEGEEISTISTFLLFPSEKLEIVGSLNFGSSAFPTPYVGEFDNTAGTIEIVRARSGGSLPASATVGSFTIKAKTGTNGNATISFDSSLSSVLINDADNTDVFRSASSAAITINGTTPTPNPVTPTPTSNPIATPDSTVVPSSDKARVWLSAGRTDLAPGQTTTVHIYLDTGNNNEVTSADLQFFFPSDILSVNENKVDVSGGTLSGISQNTIDNGSGSIDLVLFNNPPVTAGNALLGSFTVQRSSSEAAAISLANGSGVYTNDFNNTNVLSKSASAGVVFPQLSGPVVTANISPGSITVAESATVSFQSSETGSYAIKSDCSTPEVYASGQVTSANQNKTVSVAGSNLGIGGNKKLRVCVTNSDGLTGRSDELVLNITQSETVNVSICSLSPNPVINGQAVALDFVAAEAGTVTLRKGSCSGQIIPMEYSGSSFNSFALTTPSANCSTGRNTVTVKANNIGNPGSHTLALCLDSATLKNGFSSTSLTVSSSPISSGGGGGGGGARRTKGGSTGSNSNPADSGKEDCAAPKNFKALSLTGGKILFTWEKITDPLVTGLELFWETKSGEESKSIEIPKLTKLIFPAEDFKPKKEYFFTLHAVGNCKNGVSREVSAFKTADGEMLPQIPPNNDYNGGMASIIPPNSSALSTNFSANGGYVPKSGGGISGTNSVAGGGKSGGGVRGNYVSLPPAVTGSGPIVGGLLLISGAGAYVWRRRKR